MPGFAHSSEADLAELLDAYGISWENEPTTFVLDANERGQTTEAFTPDFFLPDYNAYLEVTTLRQPLVTRKNRKVRKLHEKHPDVRIKLLYRRDVETLGAKYGIADAA